MKSNVRTRLKTGDEVVVIAGRDVGKTGTITSIKKNKAFVTGINIVKKHTKPNPQLGITGGIVEQESPIDLSNIQIWDSKTKKGSRISMKIDERAVKYHFFLELIVFLLHAKSTDFCLFLKSEVI